MGTNKFSIEQVQAFVQSRVVELVLAHPPAGADLFLKASFGGEGHFFGIAFQEVDYVCIPGGVEVASLHIGQFDNLAKQFTKFQPLIGDYSGPALVIGTHENDLGDPDTAKLWLIVANRIEITRGADWPTV